MGAISRPGHHTIPVDDSASMAAASAASNSARVTIAPSLGKGPVNLRRPVWKCTDCVVPTESNKVLDKVRPFWEIPGARAMVGVVIV